MREIHSPIKGVRTNDLANHMAFRILWWKKSFITVALKSGIYTIFLTNITSRFLRKLSRTFYILYTNSIFFISMKYLHYFTRRKGVYKIKYLNVLYIGRRRIYRTKFLSEMLFLTVTVDMLSTKNKLTFLYLTDVILLRINVN